MNTTLMVDTNSARLGGDTAQLVEQRTGTLPMQAQIPGAAKDFPTLLQCPYTPVCNCMHLHLYAL